MNAFANFLAAALQGTRRGLHTDSLTDGGPVQSIIKQVIDASRGHFPIDNDVRRLPQLRHLLLTIDEGIRVSLLKRWTGLAAHAALYLGDLDPFLRKLFVTRRDLLGLVQLAPPKFALEAGMVLF